MNNNTYNGLKWSLWTLMTVFVLGCQTEDVDVNTVLPTEGITFGAAVYEGSAVKTRAVKLEDISKDITSDPYDIDFFIQLDYANPKTSETDSEIKRYQVASSYAGRLDAKDGSGKLNWKDATSDHTFYAWTLPWLEDEKDYKDSYESLDDYYDKDKDNKQKIEVVFHDSDEGDHYNEHHNNAILEKFIGAQIGPYNYKQQGNYVPLTFFHLVSQVFLNRLRVIRGDGSIHDNLNANITFIGMPKEAVFDPHPAGQIDNPHPAEWIEEEGWSKRQHHPVAIGPKEGYKPDSELTFFIPQENENDRKYHRFYVCPEVDFSQLGYKVMITTEDADEFGIEYYGDFSTVQFKRKTNDSKTDDPYDKEENGKDDTVLHAGEMMTINITLYPGVGPGATIVIQDWNDPQPTESLQHSHKGIYTDGEAQRLVDVFGDDNATQEEINNLFDMYGDNGESGEKVFKIYENVAVNGSNFPVGEGCVVDGMGHTITMSSTNNTVTVGKMRDVYITDGKNTVWIDREGNIWTLDTTTNEFEKTDYKLNGSGSTKINLATGVVS